MRIAYDYQAFCIQKYGGVSRYYVKLAQELIKIKQGVRIFAPINRNSYLSEISNKYISGYSLKRYPRNTARFLIEANKLISKPIIKAWKPTVVHETYYARSPCFSKVIPSVVTVYDMIHEIFPNEFVNAAEITRNKKNTIDRSQHIICISESTRVDLIRIYDVPPEKISVIHLGFQKLPLCLKLNHDFIKRKPFLLYVGARGSYKNFDAFLKAFSLSPLLYSEFDIIAFGGGPFSKLELQWFNELGLNITQITQVSGGDSVLASLYENAKAFIYPSIYEGFGLPPLEAMAHKCPVISSNTSSMPEVIGDAAEYFNPSSTEEIIEAICKVVFSEYRINELIINGLIRLKQYSWSKCAAETLEVYKKIDC